MPSRKPWLGRIVVAAAVVGAPVTGAADGKPKKSHLALALWRAATCTVETSVTVFSQTYPSSPSRIVDDKPVIGWTRETLKTQAALLESLTATLALVTGYSGYDDELRGAFSSPDNEKVDARYVDFKELSLRFDHEAFAVTAGKAPIPVGLSTLYRPANRYRIVNTANPMHPDDLGAWQVSVDAFAGDHALRLSLLPFEPRAPSPHRSSRWLGASGESLSLSSTATAQGLMGGATGLTAPDGATPQTVLHNRLGYLLKAQGVFPGVDYFMTAHYGQSSFPTIQNPAGNDFVLETPAAATFSGGVAATQGAWEAHGEALYQLTDGDADQDFVQYVVGITYRETALAERIGFEEIMPVVEYAGDWVTDQQDNPGRTVDSARARPLRNAVLVKVDVKPTDKLTGTLARIQHLSSQDYAQGFGIEYRATDNLTLQAIAVVFGGLDDTPFGRWDRNDHVECRATRTF